MNHTIALGIPHAPWLPGRPASLERLFQQLGSEGFIHPEIPGDPATHYSNLPIYRIFSDKEPNHAWSEKMWVWGAARSHTHFLTLQDDAIVCDDFWEALTNVLDCYPDDVIGLHVAHPASKAALLDGASSISTRDYLVGVSYCLPTALLREFLAWRSEGLKEGAVEAINEDTLLALWCASTGRRIIHPIPALVTHDISLVSGYANDHHSNRVSPTFNQGDDRWAYGGWAGPSYQRPNPLHLGAYFPSLIALAQTWVKDLSPETIKAWQADTGQRELKRLAHVMRGKSPSGAGKANIFIATPTRGGIQADYAASIWRLINHMSVDVSCSLDISDIQLWHEDIVRVRNRFVWHFLHRTDATHLLFVDSDISFPLETITGMVGAGRDFVACPYPRRDTLDLLAVAKNGQNHELPPEALAYRYSMRISRDLQFEDGGVCQIDGIGLGCALLSRSLLQRMWDDNRWGQYIDKLPDGSYVEVRNLFGLLEDNGALLSEDFSFCKRMGFSGDKVFMYLGPGSPVTHHGEWAYRGVVESFGFRRLQRQSEPQSDGGSNNSGA